jgi:hypothetical protein
MDARSRCDWCRRLVKPKLRGRQARFCSASCRQRAYERRRLEKEKQAEFDAIAAQHPAWATYLLPKPKLPPHQRPRRLQCQACKSPFVVKARGPIPETCGHTRCAHALGLYRAYLRGKSEAAAFLTKDLTAMAFLAERGRRHQTIIDNMLTDIGVPRRK